MGQVGSKRFTGLALALSWGWISALVLGYAPARAAPRPPVRYAALPSAVQPGAGQRVSLNFANADVRDVLAMLSLQSGLNIVIAPDIKRRITIALSSVPLAQVLHIIAGMTGLRLEQTGDSVVVTVKPRSGADSPDNSDPFEPPGTVSISRWNVDLRSLLEQVIAKAHANAVIVGDIQGRASLNVSYGGFEETLTRLLAGTRYGFTRDDGIYVIGDLKEGGSNGPELVRLRHLDAHSALELLPRNIAPAYLRLNRAGDGLLLSGPPATRRQVRAYLQAIDLPGPRITLDTTILQASPGAAAELGLALPAAGGLLYGVWAGDAGLRNRLHDLIAAGDVQEQGQDQMVTAHGRGASLEFKRAMTISFGGVDAARAVRAPEVSVRLTITPYIGPARQILARVSQGTDAAGEVVALKEGETLAITGRLPGATAGPASLLVILVTPRLVLPALDPQGGESGG